MPSWLWVVIAIVVAALLAVVVWQALARRRTGRLRQQFGPEYDRTLGQTDSKRDAEAELQAREEHRQQLDIRRLSRTARERYMKSWQSVQAQFVDDPRAAVANADSLIQSVMAERGYPVEDFDQRAADISVDHPQVVENYRHGHRLAQASADGSDATEELRQAMGHYRALFDELLEPAADQATRREQRGPEEEIAHQPRERTVR
jgi:FtsZ-interacting cell division protein ZipA